LADQPELAEPKVTSSILISSSKLKLTLSASAKVALTSKISKVAEVVREQPFSCHKTLLLTNSSNLMLLFFIAAKKPANDKTSSKPKLI